MRPRKRLAIFSVDQISLDVAAFVLDLAGFHVSTASTLLELDGLLYYEQPDGLLILEGVHHVDIDGIFRSVKAKHPEISTTAVVLTTRRLRQIYHADRILCQHDLNIAELRAVLKILLLRKRGAKKRQVPEPEVAFA